jgi:serine/threonine protein phosphatase PrpC
MNNYNKFCLSVPGASHKEKELVCQDYSKCWPESDYALAAVSDGHGSDKHFRSHIGSEFAVDAALDRLRELLDNHHHRDVLLKKLASDKDQAAVLRQLQGSIIDEWQKRVREHFEQHPLDGNKKSKFDSLDLSEDNEDHVRALYGATLIFAALTPDFALAAQIGDGACVFFDADKGAWRPIKEDDRLGFGLTTSLCDKDAINRFRHYFSRKPPEAIFMATDGVTDSYDASGFLSFNQAVLTGMREDHKKAEQELENWLPLLSERGSRDDMTLAGVFRTTTGGAGPQAEERTKEQEGTAPAPQESVQPPEQEAQKTNVPIDDQSDCATGQP